MAAVTPETRTLDSAALARVLAWARAFVMEHARLAGPRCEAIGRPDAGAPAG